MGSSHPTLQTRRGVWTPGLSLLAIAIGSTSFVALPLTAAPEKRSTHERIGALDDSTSPPSAAGSPAAAIEWQPSHGSECIKRGPNHGFCAGPRRVPKPRGEAAELARRLGLGARARCSRLLVDAPPSNWIEAAPPPTSREWLWPVEESRILRGVGNLEAAEKRRNAQFGRNKSRSPRRHNHEGVDIGAREGAPIRAAQSGLVVYSDNGLTGYGNVVIVVHGDGSVALYAHCRANYVFAGQTVERGDVIGEVGHTGFARGPHLHFEYRVGGKAADPSARFAPHD